MTEEQIYSRMMALCSRREYCKSDIAAKISALSDTVDAEAMIRKLCEERFIDESRYAAAFVRDKSRLKGWGEVKIRYALQRKGLDNGTIAEAMGEIDGEQQMERLAKLMKAKAQTLKDAAPAERRAKLMRFAVSRGFTYAQADEICRTIK
ncbi:MAG: RecX family transcriptional regulator [Bacteroidales bacterium]|nr:RecX family transcriptional regulator [Bacteroidales bacterium]MBO7488392.1 RecX family transcriptional regulator [Bacteroidales bacterium]